MDSQPQGFPFGIMAVVELLRLNVRRRLADSAYVDCPFCGDKRGKMNVNFGRNVWRCNYCGESGGMLALYARLNSMTNSQAYREIWDALSTGEASWGGGDHGMTAVSAAAPVSGAAAPGQGQGASRSRHGPVRKKSTGHFHSCLGCLPYRPPTGAICGLKSGGLRRNRSDSSGSRARRPISCAVP